MGDTDPINATLNEIVLRLQIGAAIIRMQLSLSLLDSNWRFRASNIACILLTGEAVLLESPTYLKSAWYKPQNMLMNFVQLLLELL